MNFVSSQELQEIVENERRRRARSELLELVAQSDLRGIVNRERRRRGEGGDDVRREKQKKRRSSLVPTNHRRGEHWQEEEPALKKKAWKLNLKAFASTKSRNKGREDERFSKMESQASSLSLDSSVRQPKSYLFYVMVCIGLLGLALTGVAVVAYLKQREEDSVP